MNIFLTDFHWIWRDQLWLMHNLFPSNCAYLYFSPPEGRKLEGANKFSCFLFHFPLFPIVFYCFPRERTKIKGTRKVVSRIINLQRAGKQDELYKFPPVTMHFTIEYRFPAFQMPIFTFTSLFVEVVSQLEWQIALLHRWGLEVWSPPLTFY